jgi:hypothetical protein
MGIQSRDEQTLEIVVEVGLDRMGEADSEDDEDKEEVVTLLLPLSLHRLLLPPLRLLPRKKKTQRC